MSNSNRCYRALDIKVSFAGVPVLRGVDFEVVPGEIHGLFGHNGAGKSTLLKILAGVNQQDSGELLIGEESIVLSSPRDALQQGIACVYQELRLIPGMTVWQNLFLGRELRKGGLLDETAMKEHTRQVLHEYKLKVDPLGLVRNLSHPDKQMLEVVANLDRDARFLFLDEPTTALEGAQAEALLQSVRRIAREKKIGVVLVSHKLDEVLGVCDEATVMCGGKVVYHAKSNIAKQDIIDAIVGDAAPSMDEGERSSSTLVDKTAAPYLEVRNLSTSRLRDVSLQAWPGEIVGIYGLAGAGRTRFCRTLFGLDDVASGEVRVAGKPYDARSPAHAISKGVGYLTEERKKDGIVPLMSSFSNATLPILRRFRKRALVDHGAAAKSANRILVEMNTRGNLRGPIKSLSGGNQQKVLLARVIGQDARLVLLDEPTKGVDIGAKADIYAIIRRMAAEGRCVVVVSSEEEELLEIADRVLVFHQGSCDGAPVRPEALSIAGLRKAAWSGNSNAA
ncbi:sugar ABC transporter ATP-binding protein [Paraburkholderia guartelaensis]|uniref:sugar ABC transporter ATP-binding protein n=1 Tax=Paraburkholderia guartelaensis TaxID=2546446 RepID=UPI002AB615F2|nr:sugar ABC transporter ATP-binding protein [Paraburkholderia guartelaensis]